MIGRVIIDLVCSLRCPINFFPLSVLMELRLTWKEGLGDVFYIYLCSAVLQQPALIWYYYTERIHLLKMNSNRKVIHSVSQSLRLFSCQ